MNSPTYHFNLVQRVRQEGFARLISDVLNPLILPPVILGWTSWLLQLPLAAVVWVIAFSAFTYCLAPLAATYYLLKKKHITSLDLPERKSRSRLFFFTIFCAAAGFLYLSTVDFALAAITLVFFLNPVVGFLINCRWKMSIHTAALSSAGGIFLSFAQLDLLPTNSEAEILSLIILLLLLPLMIWARYRLSIHTFAELFGGAVAGFLLTILELSMFSNLW